MVEVRKMNDGEFCHYRNFSFENFISELAQSSGQTPEILKSKHSKMPDTPAENDLWLVITNERKNIGFIWIQLYPEKKEAFGFDIYLDGCSRSQGIGREVMRQCSSMIRTLGIEKIKVCVFEHNTIARKLYSSFGFTEKDHNPDRKQYTLELTL